MSAYVTKNQNELNANVGWEPKLPPNLQSLAGLLLARQRSPLTYRAHQELIS